MNHTMGAGMFAVASGGGVASQPMGHGPSGPRPSYPMPKQFSIVVRMGGFGCCPGPWQPGSWELGAAKIATSSRKLSLNLSSVGAMGAWMGARGARRRCQHFWKEMVLEEPRTLPAIPFCPPANRLPCERAKNKVPCRASTDIYPFFSSPPQDPPLASAHRARAILEHCAVGYQRRSKHTVRPHAVVPDAPAEHLTNCFPESWDEQPVSHPPLCHFVALGPELPLGSLMLLYAAVATVPPVDAAIGRRVEAGRQVVADTRSTPMVGEVQEVHSTQVQVGETTACIRNHPLGSLWRPSDESSRPARGGCQPDALDVDSSSDSSLDTPDRGTSSGGSSCRAAVRARPSSLRFDTHGSRDQRSRSGGWKGLALVGPVHSAWVPDQFRVMITSTITRNRFF
ncbi:hypothetical protein QBC39DRAFT_435782 [Podospora conica]|nr:hypothetical protein QBC39DRAFT_435782 [Schizothecium conicum]